MLNALSSFKNINTIIIKASGSEVDLNQCIEATKQKLNELAPSKERRYIRIWHKSNDCIAATHYNANTYVRGYFTDVSIQ